LYYHKRQAQVSAPKLNIFTSHYYLSGCDSYIYCHETSAVVLASAVHILKLERYRED
jgi:hypothetical protein